MYTDTLGVGPAVRATAPCHTLPLLLGTSVLEGIVLGQII